MALSEEQIKKMTGDVSLCASLMALTVMSNGYPPECFALALCKVRAGILEMGGQPAECIRRYEALEAERRGKGAAIVEEALRAPSDGEEWKPTE